MSPVVIAIVSVVVVVVLMIVVKVVAAKILHDQDKSRNKSD